MIRSHNLDSQGELSSIESLAGAVAGHGFGSQLDLPDVPVPEEVFIELLARARHDRLVGAIGQLVASGAFPVTATQRELLTAHHTDWTLQSLRIESTLPGIDDSLSRAHVDYRVLKGAALARLVYSDPAWRVFSDLDIIVRSEQFDTAMQVLSTDLGGHRWMPELRPGFDREFGQEAVLAVDGLELDIHRTLVAGPFGLTIHLAEMFESSSPFVVGGRTYQAPGELHLAMHSLFNLALGDYPMRLCSVRDVLMVLDRLDIQSDELVRCAATWSATAVIRRAARLAVQSVNLAEGALHEIAALPVSRAEALLLRSYLTSARSYTRPIASLWVIPGFGPRLRYIRALAVPSAEYLRSRGRNERTHLRLARRRMFPHG